MKSLKVCFLILAVLGVNASAQEEYKCDFENGLCSFILNSRKNLVNWRIGRGNLNTTDTGPFIDHTFGNGTGSYLFVTVGDFETGQASLESVMLETDYCVRFFFHMYGAGIGDLKVSTQNSGILTEKFNKTINREDRWKEARFKITATKIMQEEGYKIIWTVKNYVVTQLRGHIAIDDIELKPGQCKDSSGDVTQLCPFDDYDGGYTATRLGSIKWEWKAMGQTTTNFRSQPASDNTLGTILGGYWIAGTEEGKTLSKEVGDAILTSPAYKNPKYPSNCLLFYYYMDADGSSWWWGDVKKAYVQAYISYPASNDKLSWLVTKAKNQTVHRQWTYVEAKVELTEYFQIQFRVNINSLVEALIALDDIQLIPGRCPKAGYCDFEEDKCTWKDGDDGFTWIRKSGSSSFGYGIGPKVDKTLGTDKGNYVVFTIQDKSAGAEAALESEMFSPEQDPFCLVFWYQMNGVDVGTLEVLMREENAWESLLWFLFGEKGNDWNKGMVMVPPGVRKNQIVFKGIAGRGKEGFMALDDIRIRKGENCEMSPPDADPRYDPSSLSCDFDEGDFCSWTADISKLSWKISDDRTFGPKFDHTRGNYLGRYAYLKGNGNTIQNGSTITSSPASPEWKGMFCFSFWYFMDVEGSSSLNVSAPYRSAFWKPLTYVSYWSRAGDYGYKWRYGSAQIESSEPSPNLRITGSIDSGVIAVDDFTAKGGRCPPSKICTFDNEDGMCGYTQDTKNTIDWTIKSGKDDEILHRIPDHTTRSKKGGYLYVDINPMEDETTQLSRIYSPMYAFSTVTNCVTFYYYIYNITNLSLNLYLATDNGLSDTHWSANIGQGPLWHGARFSAVSKAASWQVVFEVTVGSFGYGQVAIDDISIERGKCPDPGYCDFESEDCLWEDIRVLSTENNTWKLDVTNADEPTDLLVDDFDWTRHIGLDYFGPSEDNTLKSPQGFYLILDTRLYRSSEKAIYISERLSAPSGVCLKLWYSKPNYQNGASLIIYSSSDFKTAEQVKRIEDITNEVWTQAMVTVVPPKTSDAPNENFWIFLSGVTGNNSMGFVAVDDLSIAEGICENR